MGVFALLITASVPLISSWYQSSQHQEATALIADTFFDARSKALSSNESADWVVRVAPQALLLYKEVNPPEIAEIDRLIRIPQGSQIIFISEDTITFERSKGTADKEIRFVLSTGNASTQFDIYETGTINY